MSNSVDPVVVSVVRHRLLAIVEEMGEAMLRTSYSQILNSSRDFSTAICDLGGRLIAQAEHVPIHVGALPYAAADSGVSRVRAETLDDTSWLRPTAHFWTRSKQSWVELPEGDEVHETQPSA